MMDERRDHDVADEDRAKDKVDPGNEADDIAALVRLGGRRTAVAPDRSARVHEAVRAHWQETLRARGRRRRLVWMTAAAGAAAAVVALVLLRPPWPGSSSTPVAETLTVESIEGKAWSGDEAGARAALTEGSILSSGVLIETEDDGRVALRGVSASSLRLDTSTRLRLVDPVTLALDRGTLYVDSGQAGTDEADTRHRGARQAGTPPLPRAALSVLTPAGRLREAGTQYEVRVHEEGLRVRVREGLVHVERNGATHPVAHGKELTLQPDGSAITGEVSPDGQEWEWTQRIALIPDFSGRSARAFLDWMAREQGRELRFASEDLARSAEGIVLKGSVTRLRVSEALDAVLPACGMSYRVEGGVLIILPE